MNTTTTLTSTTRLALGTALAALCLGAAACGSEQTADPAGSIKQAGSQQQSRISPRAAEHQAELEAQAQRARAERADAKRWAQGHDTTEHPLGSFHADTQCRHQGHPTRGQDTCTPTAPTAGSGGHQSTPSDEAGPTNAQRTHAQYGSQKFPDIRP